MRKLFKPTLILMACSLLGQVVGFVVNIIAAKLFGAGFEMDAYLAAQTLPGFFSVVLVGGLGYVFIPAFIEHRTNNNEERAWQITNSLLFIYMGILLLLSVFGIMFAEPILEMIVPGITGDALKLAVDLSFITWPTTLFYGLVTILASIYQAYERFIYQAVAALIAGLLYIFILVVFGNHQNGIYALSLAYLLSTVLNAILLLRILSRRGKFKVNFRDPAVRSLLKLQLPIIFAAACSNASNVVNRFIASDFPEGTISYLTYAEKIRFGICAILGGGIAATIFPLMAKNNSNKNTEELKKNLSFGLRISGLIVVPVIILGTMLSIPVIRILFERGEFRPDDTASVASILPWFLLSMVGVTMANITSRTLYVLKATRVVGFIGFISIVLYLLYIPAFSGWMGFTGIAISMMVLLNLSFILQLLVLDYRFHMVERNLIMKGFLKILGAAVIPAVLVHLAIPSITLDDYSLVTVVTIIYLSLYILFLRLFRLKELEMIRQLDLFTRFTAKFRF